MQRYLIAAALLVAAVAAHSIKHIVVVMEENRSFDHLFGWASKELGIDGLTGNEYNLQSTFNASSPRTYVTKNAPYVAACDPQHLLLLTTPKIFGLKNTLEKNMTPATATMSGFIEVEHDIKSPLDCQVMDMFPPERMPVLTKLAKEFAIMDQFHCSVPGPTWPNRQFAMAATSGGSTETFSWFHGKPGNLFPQKTFFDQVTEAGGTWANYYVDTPWELFMETLARNPQNIQPMERFREAAMSQTLPTYSFINPRASINVTTGEGSNDMHPDHDVRLAEAFVNDVYETLRNSPSWNDTLLIVTFDEHGGFYDHVSPPMVGIPTPDDIPAFPDLGFQFDRLGVRIATILISPWIAKGTVISQPPRAQMPNATSAYDLTSIMATARKVLPNMSHIGPLTRRDAWAATFEHAVEGLTEPRTDCPDTAAPHGDRSKLKRLLTPDEVQREAQQAPNGLQLHMLDSLSMLHGFTRDEVSKLLATRGRSQAEMLGLLTELHESHAAKATERQTLSESYSVWCTSMMEYYWLLNVGKSHWDLTAASNRTIGAGAGAVPHRRFDLPNISEYAVTISPRSMTTPAGQRYCLDRRTGGAVGVSPCAAGLDPSVNNDAAQHWLWMPDATVRDATNPAQCLTTNIWNGTNTMSVTPCVDAVQQHFGYEGAAPGASDAGRILFGNGVYVMGVMPTLALKSLQEKQREAAH